MIEVTIVPISLEKQISGRAAELFGDVDTAANKIGLGASAQTSLN